MIEKLSNCRLVSRVSQEANEAAWLMNRTKGIGGSDIGAICGVSPFSSARQIYLNKTGQFQDVLAPNDDAKERMHFGHILEPVVAEEYQRRTGVKLVDINVTVCHKDYPWALANIDRLMVDENDNPIGVLECKTTSAFMNTEWENGDILMSYIYQLNWYLWILGLERGAFACLVGGNKFYHYDVFRNDDLIRDVLLPQAEHFWFENVRKLKEPELQASDTELVNSLYSDVVKNSEAVFDTDDVNELAEHIYTLKKQAKATDEELTAAINKFKELLQVTEIGYTKDFIIKWSPRSQERVDTEVLKTKFPEVYAQVKRKTAYRVFTIKEV